MSANAIASIMTGVCIIVGTGFLMLLKGELTELHFGMTVAALFTVVIQHLLCMAIHDA